MVPTPSNKEPGTFKLSLQRAGASKLHLVAAFNSSNRPQSFLDILIEYIPRLYKINLARIDHEVIVDVIDKLLQSTIGSLTELSIYCTRLGYYVVGLDHPRQTKFASLVRGLEAFRICGAHFDWQTVSFFTRLVGLRIDCITLGYDEAIHPFLQALASASELRGLTIIMLDTFYNPNSLQGTEASRPIMLPRLESLFTTNSFFNTLKPLLQITVPTSCRLALSLNLLALQNNLFDEGGGLFGASESVELGGEDPEWLTGPKIQRLLKALPSLKTLKMHNWTFDEDTWNNLRRSQTDQTHPQVHPNTFPALETIQLSTATIVTYAGFQMWWRVTHYDELYLGQL
ncbi:hypothetical protein B0J17DRAFT_630628 [Rhizoctonia solani]|nr:hypothetical protein B0J17DRAFT_630628 [Rhizoctonia solani]